ncbi:MULTISPECIES: tRNA (adenosine(37)-N6)-threonylcarbamoyltransferase complex ATPase subunit type 1 TsaE [Pediococcus]|jgi:tRNA threonylcarbamoyladenosine biosynthesis protein TsaE|uniref:tRNA (adenosine(37)-N6)-threonylcarbamoyltransferase complex ATPase subunit type 1 TsaE n=1 Tax=Pediococcus TaxID=1253 RepID=UPI00070EDE61|nr:MULTISPECIES: tRNA (adenosine(37)-N6)-threonylcarbamoyltransferase complex ATPase subunit type 1 TsaE [Pediococcus]MCT3027179.1 tRNA (adenosine(37)-N6)-threonylcarbamoyltransferase complex ATPase subunit type 1 TsaE [Pediococcus parvulus]MCT3029416.1 tRNA (adenosine(37)-N6)-threonylcarbamoyltransferase complex ATPase subunit type 1 TsaE [Pediococcus parvulus]MCT3030704.1 tRNA (adenosine(37)-N6)-threonylcarbamoyltransferase complex ATPase subunit type 1 TsaE [Pediococcus parvulus]MCT3033940.1
MFKIKTNDAEQTEKIGAQLAPILEPNDVLLLDGDLGAGKTTFTKGLAKGLGIKRYVKSPTFTIIHEYHEGRMPLYHMDVYRLEDGGGDDLGWDEYFFGGGVSVIEWSQYIRDYLPDDYLKLKIARNDDDDDQRILTFEPQGQHYEELVAQLKEVLE